ncbi:hypothetical protein ACPWSR_12530 [Alloiococcus sp. CFN-8]
MKRNTVYAIAWISVGAAVSIAIYVTKSAIPLVAMLIPIFIVKTDDIED